MSLLNVSQLNVSGKVPLPIYKTNNRPSGSEGDVIFNKDKGTIEFYNGQSWIASNTDVIATISISISPAITEQEFPLKIVLPYINTLQADFRNVIFADEDGNELPRWIESYIEREAAEIWIKCVSIENGSVIRVYKSSTYIGRGNPKEVFDAYSSFDNGTSLDADWESAVGTNYSIGNGEAQIGTTFTVLQTKSDLQSNIAVESTVRHSGGPITEIIVRGGGSSANDVGGKGRWDGRGGQGVGFLNNPYTSWNFTGTLVYGDGNSDGTAIPDGTHKLRIEALGEDFSLYFNDSLRIKVNQPAASFQYAGRIGIANHGSGTTFVQDIKAYKLSTSTITKNINVLDHQSPADGFAGGGYIIAQGADGENILGFVNANDKYFIKVNTDNQGVGAGDDGKFGLSWSQGAFGFHTGHVTNEWWPQWLAVKVTDYEYGKVLNQIRWVKHSNAIGNVNMWGTNNDITNLTIRNTDEYSFLGRTFFGGRNSAADGTIITQSFNPNNYGYKWYILEMVDNNTSATSFGTTPTFVSGGGWAMYGFVLDKV